MIEITKTLHCTLDLGSIVDVNVSAGQISGLNHDATTYSVSVETIHFYLIIPDVLRKTDENTTYVFSRWYLLNRL